MTSPPIPLWLRLLVRVDFVAAVVLTVIAPLVLLGRAVLLWQPTQLGALLAYWRSSSLLMITVYLLAGERRIAFGCGVVARLLIPWTLWQYRAVGDTWFTRWRWLVSSYCLVGALSSLPLLRCSVAATPTATVPCRAYTEPPREYAALLHSGASRELLGRAGELGLALFLAGATLWAFVHRR